MVLPLIAGAAWFAPQALLGAALIGAGGMGAAGMGALNTGTILTPEQLKDLAKVKFYY